MTRCKIGKSALLFTQMSAEFKQLRVSKRAHLSRMHVTYIKTHGGLVLGCYLPCGKSFYSESSEVNTYQVAYLVDGLARFDSVELKTPREYSSHT